MSNQVRKLEESGAVRLRNEFDALGACFALVAEVFEDIGGKQAFVEYAEENRGWFYSHMLKMGPGVAPVSAQQGDVTVIINNSLGQTALDIQDIEHDG